MSATREKPTFFEEVRHLLLAKPAHVVDVTIVA
jgi:hypothetical protein